MISEMVNQNAAKQRSDVKILQNNLEQQIKEIKD